MDPTSGECVAFARDIISAGSLVAVCRNAGLRKIKLMGSACVSRTPAQCCHGAEYLTFGQLHLQVELTIKDSARLGHRRSV